MNRLSIRSKLMMMMLSVSLVSVATVAFLAFRSGERVLTESVFNHLTSVRASKAYQIESYFENVRAQVATLGEDHMIAQATERFRDAFTALDDASIPPAWDESLDAYYRDEFLPRLQENVEGSPVFETYRPGRPATRYLQHQYVTSNPNPVGEKQSLDDAGDASVYSTVHAEYHPVFRRLVEKFGYYDMFLIDAQTGAIVYSVYKETDYATSLRDGPYSNTNLAAVVDAVRSSPDRGLVRMIDFAPYRPSYAAPAAFIATPIYDGHRHVGILAFQLPVDEINRIMTGNQSWERDGLGKSGETYLVGPDSRMRSISRFLIEDPKGYARALRNSGVPESSVERLLSLGTSILQQEVRTPAARAAMHGKSGTRIVDDYRGVPVLSSFAPLQIPDVSWLILSEIDLAEAYAPTDAFFRRMIVSAVVLMLVVTLLAMLFSASFVRPIRALADGARRVAQGETDVQIESGSGDEFGELAHSFNDMVASVRTQNELVEAKSRESEDLLTSILPKPVARRLKAGEESIADAYDSVTVLFSDLVGFTQLSRKVTAEESVSLLNELVSSFDEAADEHGVEKIKTIGDNYMAASGLATSHLDHAKRAVDLALEMLGIVRRFSSERRLDLELRIGLHSGPLVAGVIGRNRFLYDLWGETVSTANRMKSEAEPGEVVVTPAVAEALGGLFTFQPVQRGEGETVFVVSRASDLAAAGGPGA
jgi:class 3 adenylate cyclase